MTQAMQIPGGRVAVVAMAVAAAATLAGWGPIGGVQAAARPAAGQTLVLYEASGYAPAVAAAFEKKTGIRVDIVHLATGPLAAKIEAEGRYPQWDVAWFDDQTTMRALANLGLINEGWTPSDVSNYDALGRAMLPGDRAYFPMGYTAAAAIAYNPKAVPAADVPTTWADLLKPVFKNDVAMNNPAISGPTYPFVAGILQQMGMARGKRFFLDLKKNGLQVYAKNGPTIQALLTGKVDVALAQDAALIGQELAGADIKVVYPQSGVFQLENVMAIAKNAPDKRAAEAFVEYCLTPAAQAIMSNPRDGGTDSYRTSVIQGVGANPHVPAGVHWVTINTPAAARIRASVLQWFTENIVQ
jgi:iron(III) transport system substrate-binding protein